MKLIIPLYRISLFFFIISCSSEEPKNLTPIAEVYDKKLYLEDVKYLFEDIASEQESLQVINDYINLWVEKQILVTHAQKEIENSRVIEIKVEAFKNDLMIHDMYKRLIEKRLDTTVKESELIDYYKNHKEEFLLKDYLVKVLYLKIPDDVEEIPQIDRAYRNMGEEDVEFLKNIAQRYALNFYYDTDAWIYFEDLTKEIPLKDYNKQNLILNKSRIKISEGNIIYYLNILDARLKDALSPLEFEKENIRNRILNKRILNFRRELQDSLIKKAYEEDKVNIL